MLSGYPPFYNPNMGLLFKQILTAAYTFEMDCWRTVSKQVRRGRGGKGEEFFSDTDHHHHLGEGFCGEIVGC